MSFHTLPEGLIRRILECESSSIRFEDLCIELFSESEGMQYVRTSTTWDLGKDGRLASPQSDDESGYFICCSLQSDIEAKAIQDLNRILENHTPTRLLVCSNQSLSEHLIFSVERQIRSHCPSLQLVTVNGLRQLTQLVARFSTSFLKLYRNEIQIERDIIACDVGTDDNIQLLGLRIAITTQLHDDAQMLREDLLQNLVLTALKRSTTAQPISELAKTITAQLHLPRILDENCLALKLAQLTKSRHITMDNNNCYSIALAGSEELDRRMLAGEEKVIEGRTVIADLLEELTGQKLENMEFLKLWAILQDGLAKMFLTNGINIIEQVVSITDDGKTVHEQSDLHQVIIDISNRVKSANIGGPHALDYATAIMDMFHERQSKAFTWLSGLCGVFVSLCALGLDSGSQKAIKQKLAEIELILDTDIVLALLCEAEFNRDIVKRFVRSWILIGGTLRVPPAVLEEVVHHADIATREYNDMWRCLNTMTDQDAARLLQNTFVRGFRIVAKPKGKYNLKFWNIYINQFRGDAGNFEKILGLLRDSNIKLIEEGRDQASFAAEVAQSLLDERQSDNDLMDRRRQLKEKCDRDGRMIALLRSRRDMLRDSGRYASIVSSAGFLKAKGSLCKDKLGPPEPVMSLAAVGWMLSQLPNVSMNLGSLRAVLFDVGFAKNLSPDQRDAMRAVQASEQYSLSWSRRDTLSRAISDAIPNLAKQYGLSTREMRDEIENKTPEGKAAYSAAIADALDKITTSKLEHENEELKKRIRELQSRK